jgi:hypothetical protein
MIWSLAYWQWLARNWIVNYLVLTDSIRKSIVHINFKSFFVKHENFVLKVRFCGRKVSECFLEIFINHFLDLLFAHFVLRLNLIAHCSMFEDLSVNEWLFTSMTEYFQLLNDFFNFVVNVLWLLLRFADRLWTHPYHVCVNAWFTIQTVASCALKCKWCIIVWHWRY